MGGVQWLKSKTEWRTFLPLLGERDGVRVSFSSVLTIQLLRLRRLCLNACRSLIAPCVVSCIWISQSLALDLANAVIVAPEKLSIPEKKAVSMLVEEVQKRTQIRWERASAWPSGPAAVVAIGLASELNSFAGEYAEELSRDQKVEEDEGYRIRVKQGKGAPAVFVIGNDTRGVLFGIGHLLCVLRMSSGTVTLPDDFSVATAPRYRLRGHQLGYRPKTNSYDAWDEARWEQYIRDLVVFGCNAIELIPPRSDDDASSPHFPLPQMEMMVVMSRLADEYGLDVWIWYPAMDRDYSDPQTVEFALKEWGDVFKKLPRVDAVFVPGGDPGHTRPKVLMDFLAKQTEKLHRYHAKAQMWVSPQSFNQSWLEEFIGILRSEQPNWLSGVVYGPQIRVSLPQLRAAIPQKFPIRHYPDITHCWRCEYPVPDWDSAFAATEGREPINPRPLGQATIFRLTQPDTIGFLTYSEGCNDDVNKTVWSALGWDPEVNLTNVLRDYSRYFIGDQYAEDFAQGLLALESNWHGALLTNESVFATLKRFQAMEQSAWPQLQRNWRFQQGLYRAYYDAYTRSRLLYETGLEDKATAKLGEAKKLGSLVLIVQGHPEAVNDIDQREGVAAAPGSIQARNLENGAIPVTGYRLTSAYHAFGLTRATTRDGRTTATWGDPKDVWVLEFAAPPQQGWAHVSAFVVIDARSGNVDSFSEAKNN